RAVPVPRRTGTGTRTASRRPHLARRHPVAARRSHGPVGTARTAHGDPRSPRGLHRKRHRMTDTPHERSPWPGLWALVIGFFMILVDTTIVSVANPAIKADLDPGSNNLDNVVWVTSAYLLAYAVPLLITGRLGDRFGPKNIYLIGLVVFTVASLW